MCWWGLRKGWVVGSIFFSGLAAGQNLMLHDSIVLMKIEDPANPGISLVKYRFTQDAAYSLTTSGLLFFNHENDDKANNITLLQNLKYQSLITNGKKLRLTGSWQHDLGVKYYFDSITTFNPDANSLDVKLEVRQWKNSSIFWALRLTTRIFNAYDFETDISGSTRKVLKSSFLTPMICLFSAGVAWKNPRIAEFNIGLSGGKATWIRDKTIYSRLGVGEFYGVREDQRLRLEFGLVLQVLVDQDFFKRIHWNCDLQLFKDQSKPPDVILKNRISVKITRIFKATMQTRLDYDEDVSRKVQVENLITVGFGIQL